MGDEMLSGPDDGHPWSMSDVRVIAFPAGASWTGPLRLMVESLGLKLKTADSTAACREMIEQRPASLLVLEVMPGETNEQLRLLVEISRQRPLSRVVMMLRDGGMSAANELLARELGACDVLSRVSEFDRLRVIVKAHVTQARSRYESHPALLSREVDITPPRL